MIRSFIWLLALFLAPVAGVASPVEYQDERRLSTLMDNGFRIVAVSPIIDNETQVGFHVFLHNDNDLLFCGSTFELFAGLDKEFEWCVMSNQERAQ